MGIFKRKKVEVSQDELEELQLNTGCEPQTELERFKEWYANLGFCDGVYRKEEIKAGVKFLEHINKLAQ
jgi:hypothetical protein